MSTQDPTDQGLRLPTELQGREAQLDPFPWYRRMREESPIQYDESRGCWDVFAFDDVKRVLRDHEAFSSNMFNARGADSADEHVMQQTMITVDPPEHDRLRSMVDDFFEPGAVRDLRPHIVELADDLLDEAAAGGEMDLVSEFAYPLPVMVIAELLGVPTEDRERFKRWSDLIVASPDTVSEEAVSELQQEQEAAQREMGAYFMDLIRQRSEEPRDDLITKLVRLGGDDDGLSQREIIGFCVLLLVAGNITTTNLVTNAVRTFLDEGVWAELQRDRSLLPTALEEVLRFQSPVQSMSRAAKVDVELGGERIGAGDVVVAWIGSANRDPDQFADAAEFVPTRKPNTHIAFGSGVHYCLGAPLARLEAEVALSALLDRVDDPRVAGETLDPVTSPIVHGVKSLPLRFDRRE